MFWGWIAIIVICGIVANSKNRSVFFWSFVGMIFGIFALIVLALLPALPRPYHQNNNKLTNCPACGHTVSRKARECPRCGNPL